MVASLRHSPDSFVHGVASDPVGPEAVRVIDIVEDGPDFTGLLLLEIGVLISADAVATLDQVNIEPVSLEIDLIEESESHIEQTSARGRNVFRDCEHWTVLWVLILAFAVVLAVVGCDGAKLFEEVGIGHQEGSRLLSLVPGLSIHFRLILLVEC